MSEQQHKALDRQISGMFDRIAHRYDLLNRMLSFGRDVAWRKQFLRYLPGGAGLRVLDLATGTADVLLSLYHAGRLAVGLGVDPSGGMLAEGRKKVVAQGAAKSCFLVRGDAMELGLREDTFDAVTIAFGIRNVTDVDKGLREMLRVLRPGGRALILEFSLPGNGLIRWGYLLYFRHVLPLLGGLISGDQAAYRYLNRTVEAFPYGGAFCALMEEAGFEGMEAHPMTFGIATLYCGDKPGPS
jgi:demethylmenaquinone methyltransferase/2-methoxy-6-polyprenyl-1,4-benzoquinol methylase